MYVYGSIFQPKSKRKSLKNIHSNLVYIEINQWLVYFEHWIVGYVVLYKQLGHLQHIHLKKNVSKSVILPNLLFSQFVFFTWTRANSTMIQCFTLSVNSASIQASIFAFEIETSLGWRAFTIVFTFTCKKCNFCRS